MRKNKTLTLIFLSFLITCLFSSQSVAQVTIGFNTEPLPGAILQLKDRDNNSGDENSNRGLGLPRVHLEDANKLYPMFSSGYAPSEDANHIGLIVFNTNRDVCLDVPLYKGVNVWDGDVWNALGDNTQTTAEIFIGQDQDGNDFPYRQFGDAGYWMLTNLRARKYAANLNVPSQYELQATPHPAGSNKRDVALWNYPHHNGAVTNSEDFDLDPTLGLLYNWAAATYRKGGSTGDGNVDSTGALNEGNINHVQRQGICPENWHLPSDKEWSELEGVIYDYANLYSEENQTLFNPLKWASGGFANMTGIRGSTPNGASSPGHGNAMKCPCQPVNYTASTSTPHGTSGTSFYAPLAAGFNMKLTGHFNSTPNIHRGYGDNGYVWTNSAGGDSTGAWIRAVTWTVSGVYRSYEGRGHHFSVRCKRDY